jgi:GNAT superfamily N-acetyltransferase
MVDFGPVVLLASSHDRRAFDCGIESLNVYLKQYALQNQKKGIVRNYVVCRGPHIVGYYSLAYGSVAQTEAPPALTKGIGNYPVPKMILARLAVDLRQTGQNLGKALLKNAVLRTLQAADIAGLKVIFVQAKDDNARQFYEKHGLADQPDLPYFFPAAPIGYPCQT